VELRDGEAAFTSGDYERYFDSAGGRMHHILDPTTGYPATHTQAVTVLADEGTLADAAATAIFVAGPARWRDVARKMAVDAVLRVTSDGQIEVTPAMRDRLQISTEHVSDIIVVSP
jgi:thiamine biosynthesis lipoprotein